MEGDGGGGSWDLGLLLSLLSQGEQQARQLEANLEAASADEQCRSLLQQIRSNLEEAISTAKLMDSTTTSSPAAAAAASDSPQSHSGSPRSEDSERVFKEHERREMCKKRKTLPKWTSQVRISGGSAAEGLEDGYSWRKYGQKEILGARHPRGYYRCTHRNSVGCLATKQVQRSDKDPCLFDISYRGEHTCLHKLLQVPPAAPPKEEEEDLQQPPAAHPLIPPPPPMSSTTCQPEPLELQTQLLPSSSFSFPSTPLHGFAHEFPHEAQLFSASAAAPLESSSFMPGFSPAFISPTATTSDSNFFSLPPSQMSCYGGGILPNTSESDLTEIISAATSNSTTNSPRMNAAAFMMDQLEFDPVFPFDPSKFF